MHTGVRSSKHFSSIIFLVLGTLPAIGFAQDTTPPSITALSFTPAAINTSTGPATVNVNFTLTDTGTGVFYFETGFVDPSGVFIQRASKIFSPPLTSVTDSVAINFPQFSPQGTWNIAYVFLADQSGNTLFLDANGVAAAGFTSTLLVSSAVDNTPPNITAFSLSPASIDTTAAAASVNVNFTLTDDLAGANFFQVQLTSPSGSETQSKSVSFTAATTVTSSASLSFPRFSEAGTWTVTSVFVADGAGNTLILDSAGLAARGFPTTLMVTSTTDTTAPVLTQFSFTPSSINVTGAPANVTVSFRVTDDLSGATTVQVQFLSPTGATTQTASASFAANTSVTGTAIATFPKGSENGTWSVGSVFLSDASGNTSTLATADITALGFSTQLTVTNAAGDVTPPVIVPTVSPAPNAFGWNTTVPVTVSWSVTDPESGINTSTGCTTSTLTAQTTGTTFTCSATNNAGLSNSVSVAVRIDLTPPIITSNVSPTPTVTGWNNTDTTLTWSLSDPTSNIDSESGCGVVTFTAETAGITTTCNATNGAGLSTSASVTVKIDKTPPTATAVAAPSANGAGWNNTNVTVTFAGTDALSGIASCTAPVVLSTEGVGQSASGICTDNAGNNSAVATASGIKIDKTAPVASNVVATPNPLEINNSTVITATITDSLSGVASAAYNIDGGSFIAMTGTFGGTSVNVSATTAVFTTTGLHNFCVAGTDVAGNVGSTQCILVAVYDPNGGFVTGGGGSNSPAGSDSANPSGSGPVTHAFDLKYLPSQTVPSGDLEFHYNAGNIVFKSTSWDFLVVTNGNHGQAQGTGTINGSTVCKFSLDAWDASFQPGNVDAFGLTIYNCAGGTGNRYNLVTAPITNGNIKVH